MSPTRADDWTAAWAGQAGLAISSWTRSPHRLRDPASARLLALVLQLTALECRLSLRGWVVLPGALHLVTGRRRPGAAPPLLSWAAALGRIKGLHARCDNRRRGATGSLWKPGARIRPLAPGALPGAVELCETAPVGAGLCERPEDWPWSSASAR